MNTIIDTLISYSELVAYRNANGQLSLRGSDCYLILKATADTLKEFLTIQSGHVRPNLEKIITQLNGTIQATDQTKSFDYNEELISSLTRALSSCDDVLNPSQIHIIAFQIAARLMQSSSASHQSTPAFKEHMLDIMQNHLTDDAETTQGMLVQCKEMSHAITNFIENHRPFLTAAFSNPLHAWHKQLPDALKTELDRCKHAFYKLTKHINGVPNLKKRSALFIHNSQVYFNPLPAIAVMPFESAILEACVGLTNTGNMICAISTPIVKFATLTELEQIKTVITESKLFEDLKKSITFVVVPLEQHEQQHVITSPTCYRQGYFTITNRRLLEEYTRRPIVTEQDMSRLLGRFNRDLPNMSWEASVTERGSYLAFARENNAAMKIICFRFPIVTDLFRACLPTLQQAADNWEAWQQPKIPISATPKTPMPLSPISPNVRAPRCSPIHKIKRTRNLLSDDENDEPISTIKTPRKVK